MQTVQDVPILLRREIEALMVAPILEAFEREIGRDRARRIVREVVRGLALKAGQQGAAAVGGNTFEHFKIMDATFAQGGALEGAVVIDEDGCGMHKNITRCRYSDMYERLGLKELGALLSCERDGYLFQGFNPDWEFTRTHTIMEGADHCDFCLREKERK